MKPSQSIFALSLVWAFLAMSTKAADLPRFHWQNFTVENGLPDNRVYSVAVDGDKVWAGTDNGLAALRKRQVEELRGEGWPGAPGRSLAGPGQTKP